MKPHHSLSPGNTLLLYLRSGAFLACQVVLTLALATSILLLRPAPFHWRYQLASLWVRTILWLLKVICGLSYQVTGQEHIPERSSIIFCKHQSAWETIALQAIFPPVVFILKRELLNIPFFGWSLSALEAISIDRGSRQQALRQVIQQGTQRLNDGRWVVIFPEGTRVAPGEKRTYAAGGAMLAEQAGYPVVPVAHNAGTFWGRHSFLKYPGTIQVRIGPVIETQGRRARDINAEAEAWIEGQMKVIDSRGQQRSGGLNL